MDGQLTARERPGCPDRLSDPAGPFWFQEIAVVPCGHLVPASWSVNTWLPWMSLFVQQPCITPELSTGPGRDVIAAVAIPVPAARARVVTPAAMTLGAIAIMVPPLVGEEPASIAPAAEPTWRDSVPLPPRPR